MVAGPRRGVANKAYPDHIQLSTFEHAFLTVGTGLAALLDPRRGGKYDKLGKIERNSCIVIRYGGSVRGVNRWTCSSSFT